MSLDLVLNIINSFLYHPSINNFQANFHTLTQINLPNDIIDNFINDIEIRYVINDFFINLANTNDPEIREEIFAIINSFFPCPIRAYLFELFTEAFDRGYYETKEGGNIKRRNIKIDYICFGGKLNVKTLQQVIKNGYKKNKVNELDGYRLDPQLSGSRAQVYHNEKNNKTIINHRGTQGINDLITDLKMSLGNTNNKRFNHGKNITDKAIEKYAGSDFTITGHSLGAKIAKEANKAHNKDAILFNPVVLPNDKFDVTDTIVKSKLDPVSFLYYPKSHQSKTIMINPKSFNLLKEHNSSILDRLDDKIEI